jgi:hypothetical protein
MPDVLYDWPQDELVRKLSNCEASKKATSLNMNSLKKKLTSGLQRLKEVAKKLVDLKLR